MLVFLDLRGERQEKIVSKESDFKHIFLPISGGLDIEALYKHLSGYYKSLKNTGLGLNKT